MVGGFGSGPGYSNAELFKIAKGVANVVKQGRAAYNSYPSPKSTPKLGPRHFPKPPAPVNAQARYGTYRGGSGRSVVLGRKKRKFVKKRRASVKRRKSRPSKKKLVVNDTNGVTGRVEAYQKVRDVQAVYCGHSSIATSDLSIFVARAITKAFWAKEGLTVTDDSSVGPSVTSFYNINYFPNSFSLTSLDAISATVAASATFATHATAVRNLMLIVIPNADLRYQFTTFSWFSTDSVSGYKFRQEANMNQTKVVGYVMSSFAAQNATPNATGGLTTDVNNANPLTVHTYYGSGNGTYHKARSTSTATFQSFIGTPTTGSISVVGSEIDNGVIKEPPSAKVFKGCKKGPTFILQPGAIFKRYLKTAISMSISSYINMHNGYAVLDNYIISRGRYQFFAFDKIISTVLDTGATSNVPITIDSEIDLKTRIKCVMKHSQITAPTNTEVVIATKG